MQHDISQIIGSKISLAWVSDGSVMYLEIGDLQPGNIYKNEKIGRPIGEYTIYLGSNWRIERSSSKIGNKKLTKSRIEQFAKFLHGKEIVSIEFVGRIPELSVGIANNIWISTFDLDGEQPEWSIKLTANPSSWLCVENGKLCIDGRD